jgi:hypothetical protein
VRLQPLGPGAENAARAAKRVMQQYQVGAPPEEPCPRSAPRPAPVRGAAAPAGP